MIYLLPTQRPGKYRGIYPTRIHSWGYSQSPAQTVIAEYLGIKRPIHIELNNGRRYIVDMRMLKSYTVRLGAEFMSLFLWDNPIIEILGHARYDEMLDMVRRVRDEEAAKRSARRAEH